MAPTTELTTKKTLDSSLTAHYERQLRILLDRLEAHENCRHEDCHARHEYSQFTRLIKTHG